MEEAGVIHIERAYTNNLKGVSVDIPRNALTVITGVSGSGKSSLAFDTLYVEGRRRYVESLKSYTRNFLGQLPKPPVERIDNLPPSIAIQQKRFSSNPRSTVGTMTEIYDYLKLLYAKMGRTYSPYSNKEIKRHSVTDLLLYLSALPENTKVYILAPLAFSSIGDPMAQLERWKQSGYARIFYKKDILPIDTPIVINDDGDIKNLYLLIDRQIIHHVSFSTNRMRDSVKTAFSEGGGHCSIYFTTEDGNSEIVSFSNLFEEDGIKYTVPSVHFFDFNNPLGQCPRCKGLGYVTGIDEDIVIADKSLSVYEGAITCWQGAQMQKFKNDLINNAHKFDFPVHTPYNKLSREEKLLLWRGNEYFTGLDAFFQMLNNNKIRSINDRYLLMRLQGKSICPDCGGSRLKKETDYVKINGKNISQVCNVSVSEILKWLQLLSKADIEQSGVGVLYDELYHRLDYLQKVGLSYLTLNREASTLSGGESQRLMLTKMLGNSLVGALYVLDEPSIGLHPRDTERLINVLKDLRDLHNTIVVVEHDEEIILAADNLIFMGPRAGSQGGEIVYQGMPEIYTPTALSSTPRRPILYSIQLNEVVCNNLKDISVTFPLQVLTVVSGVSGSGKSTLVEDVLYTQLSRYLAALKNGADCVLKNHIQGHLDKIDEVVLVNQSVVGMSSRSNPATYTKVYDDIRSLFASLGIAKQLGLTASHFSFNTPGGRCEYCKGEGKITFEMQFLSDVVLTCDKCNGKRFKQEILDITYRDKSIYDVLCMTVDEAIAFFSADKKNKSIVDKLQPLHDVGIGYIRLGQSLNDLSGGECQRLKIASFLKEKNTKHVLFLFDEPTIGLGNSDIQVLLKSFDRLIQNGHSIIVIEHNPMVLWAADYIIDLGPEGGDDGGYITFSGTPEKLIHTPDNFTAMYLKQFLNNRKTHVE